MDKNIGLAIKEKRLALGLTQLELASKIHVSIGTISALESGRKKSSSTTVLILIGKELDLKFEI